MMIHHHHYTRERILNWGRYRRAHFMQSLAGPRAVFLVGSVNGRGHVNAAPFNSVQHLSSDPPQIAIMVRPKGQHKRHTLDNIMETGWFTLNSVGPQLVSRAHQASAKFAEEESECDRLSIPVFYSPLHKAPYVSESRFCVGLELSEHHRVGASKSTLLIGDVREVFVPSTDVEPDGHMGPSGQGPVVVSGLNHYGKVRSIQRLDYPAQPVSLTPK